MQLRGIPPSSSGPLGTNINIAAWFGLSVVSQPAAFSSLPQVGVQLVCRRLLTTFFLPE